MYFLDYKNRVELRGSETTNKLMIQKELNPCQSEKQL